MSEKNNSVNNIYVPEEYWKSMRPIGELNIVEGTEKPQPLFTNNANNFSTVNQTATTGTIGVANGLVNSGTLSLYPWWYQTYSPQNYYKPAPWVSIEKAENGFIVVKGGLTFVCKNVKEVTDILSKKD